MKEDAQQPAPLDVDFIPEQYQDSPWPEQGRNVFGPWCLLGAWPAVFGVIEPIEKQDEEKK